MYELEFVNGNKIAYLTSPALLERSIFLAFTTRNKGFSNPPYDSLNLAFHVDDQPQTIIKNRKLLAKEFGFDIDNLTCAQQVHGNNVTYISSDEVGRGVFSQFEAINATDGLVTDIPKVPLGMFFADCLPVVLVGFEPKIIGVAHAGYKGLLNNVIGNLQFTINNCVKSSNFLAFLGPSIGPCCYQVDDQRLDKFKQKFKELDFTDDSLDLKAIAIYQLKQLGIKESNIFSADYCTSCNKDLFFSYRQSNITGRHAAIAIIG